MDFSGRVALVTGSSRGIGRELAMALARVGADVVVNHRSSGRSEDLAAEVCAAVEALGQRAIAVRADISEGSEVRRLLDAVERGFGRLDFLVLNAARAPFKPFERLLERDLRQLVNTNYLGNVLCLRHALPLLEAHSGKAVFVSSLGSRLSMPEYPLGSIKAAMEAVVRDCGVSLGARGVSVNAVCAGLVKTDSLKTLRLVWPGVEKLADEQFVTVEEVADVVLFLCSSESRGIVGQTIVVDRGFSLLGPLAVTRSGPP